MSNHVFYTHCPCPTAFGVALRKGWIHEDLGAAGIEVRALGASSDPDIQRFRRNRVSPRSFRQGGNVAPLIARSRGNDVRLIGLTRISCQYPLLTLPGSGIRTANDLIGKRIAVPYRPNVSVDVARATALRTIQSLMASSNLTLNEAEIVDVLIEGEYFDYGPRFGTELIDGRQSGVATQAASRQKSEVLALIRGEVDVIASEGATAATLSSSLGLVPVEPGSTAPDDLNNRSLLAVTVSGGLLDREPELVTRVLVQILAAAEWSVDEEAESRRLLALDSGIHEDLLDVSFGGRANRQLSVDLRPDKIEALRSQHDFLIEHGIFSNPVDFDGFIEPGPLKAALAQRGVLV